MRQQVKFIDIRFVFALAVFACSMTLAGCGDYSAADHRVDPELARETLKSVLESWKEGATPESWRQKTPEVVVQDMDWNTGKKLKNYELTDDARAVDANMLCPVKLTLVDESGKEQQRTARYIVSTSPALTVFREPGT